MDLEALVVDDSATYRTILTEVLRNVHGVGAVRKACDGKDALRQVSERVPDVVFLDIVMPGMDGLEVLTKLKAGYPDLPVVMVSGAARSNARVTVKSLEAGALAFVSKPTGGASAVRDLVRQIADIVAGIDGAALSAETKGSTPQHSASERRAVRPASGFLTVAIGVSTGGPRALAQVIPRFSADFPLPILVVQHMPEGFTEAFAESLNSSSKISVAEARAGEKLQPGRVYLAPGGKHMIVRKSGAALTVGINDGPPVNGVKPAFDVLLRSLVDCGVPRATLAVVMTGMGGDGLDGIRAMRSSGCVCLTQSPSTCTVYGMPRAVDEAGLSDESVPLEEIARRVEELIRLGGGE
jgi:two-component system chemotaxis response regulator CheB